MIGNRLGRGSTSYVFKTQSIRTKKYYAMKVVDKCSGDYKETDLLREISIHRSLHHRHICRFIKHFEDDFNHYIVTEYCRDGEITQFLMKPLSESKLIIILSQMLLALDYMHNSKGVAHGDIKLSNILINGSDFVNQRLYRKFVISASQYNWTTGNPNRVSMEPSCTCLQKFWLTTVISITKKQIFGH